MLQVLNPLMSGRKANIASDTVHIIYLISSHVVLLLPWVVFSGDDMLESGLHFENVNSKVSTQPFNLLQAHSQQKELKILERSPTLVLCDRTVRNSKLLHELHTGSFFFLLFRCSFPPQMSTNSYSNKNEHCSPQLQTQESILLPLLSKVCFQFYKACCHLFPLPFNL